MGTLCVEKVKPDHSNLTVNTGVGSKKTKGIWRFRVLCSSYICEEFFVCTLYRMDVTMELFENFKIHLIRCNQGEHSQAKDVRATIQQFKSVMSTYF